MDILHENDRLFLTVLIQFSLARPSLLKQQKDTRQGESTV